MADERFTLAELARRLAGVVEGDDRQEVTGIESITRAGAGQIAVVLTPAKAAAARASRA